MITHGFSIGINRVDEHFFLTLKAVGKLTHEDYEKMMPLIDSALESVKEPKIKALVDLSEFEGWELRAAWDDMKIGLTHNSEFEKIAICGNSKKWIEYGIKVADWFTSGEIEQFDNISDATKWLDNSEN